VKADEFYRCTELIGKGVANAMGGLSQMIGQEIEVRSFGFKHISATDIPQLAGGPEVELVGIYSKGWGSARGHIMLVCGPDTARAFVDLLMGQRRETTQGLGEMERSALEEMANVIGSLFLNALADAVDLYLRPSPPTVTIDMAGALLDALAADVLLTQDEAFVTETSFHVAERDVSGLFFLIATEDLLNTLLTEAVA
jgi:chemotaxis protein CheC